MIWLALPALAAAAYYLLALVAALLWRSRGARANGPLPPLSILKPVCGRDPRFYEAIRSHATQDYPEFEILFGTADPDDPALEDVARLQREFPQRDIRVAVVKTDAPNVKVGVLTELARQARYETLLVNDSDIVAGPGYLRAVARPLAGPDVGLVTCLYRAAADSWPSRFEALGIATDFAPSVLVARLVGQVEFALGSTLAFRAERLREIGGFEAIADYLADDYQLGRRIVAHGRGVEFAPAVVETNLGAERWVEAWRHQLRWARTIRVSRRAGYFGSVVTQATVWALVAFAAQAWWAGAAALALRVLAGVAIGRFVLRDRAVVRFCWLIPLRDLFGFAVWVGGVAGNTVHWRGQKLRLQPDGRIHRVD